MRGDRAARAATRWWRSARARASSPSALRRSLAHLHVVEIDRDLAAGLRGALPAGKRHGPRGRRARVRLRVACRAAARRRQPALQHLDADPLSRGRDRRARARLHLHAAEGSRRAHGGRARHGRLRAPVGDAAVPLRDGARCCAFRRAPSRRRRRSIPRWCAWCRSAPSARARATRRSSRRIVRARRSRSAARRCATRVRGARGRARLRARGIDSAAPRRDALGRASSSRSPTPPSRRDHARWMNSIL